MLADAADHFSVDKCAGGCTAYVQLHAALFLQNADRKILITLQQLLTIIQIVAAVQHRQGAATIWMMVRSCWSVIRISCRSSAPPGRSCETGCISRSGWHRAALPLQPVR